MGTLYGFVRSAQKGNEKAREQLFKDTLNRSYYIASSLLGDDELVREALTRTYYRMNTELATLAKPNDFEPWLFAILATEMTEVYRAVQASPFEAKIRSGYTEVLDSASMEGLATLQLSHISTKHTDFVEMYSVEKNREVVQHIYAHMGNEQLAFALLYYVCGLSCQAMSDNMSCPIEIVGNRVEAAEKSIKKGVLEMVEIGWDLGEMTALEFGINAIKIDIARIWHIPPQFGNKVMAGVIAAINQHEAMMMQADSQPTVSLGEQKTTTLSDEPATERKKKSSILRMQDNPAPVDFEFGPVQDKFAKKDHKLKTILIGLIVVLVLAIAGVGIWWALSKNTEEEKTGRKTVATITDATSVDVPEGGTDEITVVPENSIK